MAPAQYERRFSTRCVENLGEESVELSELVKIRFREPLPVCSGQLPRKIPDNRFAIVGAPLTLELLLGDASAQQPIAYHQRDVDGAPGGGLRAVDDRARIGDDVG